MYTEDRKRLARILSSHPGPVVRIAERSSGAPAIAASVIPFRSGSFRVLANVADSESKFGGRDVVINDTRSFSYTVIAPECRAKRGGAILLLHGLNEKLWDKYLPWAKELSALTGRAVILFPIAFHMNRAPSLWSTPRAMSALSQERKRLFAARESSFANAALSSRLQSAPERLIWSGLETYYDLLQVIEEVRSGRHPVVDRKARIDLFGYSIGALLAEVLLLDNYHGLFSDSRVFLFCGGSTLSAMWPVSRYIIDSTAHQALADYYGEHFESNLASTAPLRRLFERVQDLGTSFRSMLFLDRLGEFRVPRLKELGKRLAALVLKRDRVVPSGAVTATLSAATHSSGWSPVTVVDFPYRYTHEEPFPVLTEERSEVESAFRLVMNAATSLYS